MSQVIEALPLERRIWLIRGKRVMLDSDLAELYGVLTKRLNEQVKRNPARFPESYVFRLTAEEAGSLARSRSQIATLKRGQNIKYRPLVFTEHGAVMLACVLNSPVAVRASLKVVDAFVRLRDLIAERDGLGRKIADLEKAVGAHSAQIGRIFDVLNDLLPAEPPRKVRKIGFRPTKPLHAHHRIETVPGATRR